jgi:hypothetical protein
VDQADNYRRRSAVAAASILGSPKLLRLRTKLRKWHLMEKKVKDLFERYEKLFQMALKDQADMDQVASSYAAAFIAASPAGVSVGRNDEH